ncbi:MAG: dihydrodipicolinate synthase family protein [Lachnospiraceae bacterium]|nr:dihydrodipicolinate synthase family protein [Cuneatibacter sp.]MDD6456206.1 dihydrodipicolinate synthase family protein [Lachnospiraceae bacterium]
MEEKLKGIVIPAVTPFDEKEEVSVEMLAANYEKWNQTDVKGYMCLGSNGEFRALSDDESLTVIKESARLRKPGSTLIAGVGRESLYQTLKFIDRVQELDADIDYISVLVPHYFAKLMDDAAVIDYYSAIGDFAKIPVLLYCAPAFANNLAISAEAVKVLADHPNIAGIKDTSKDMMNAYMDAAGGRDDFTIMAGSLSNLMTCYERGGAGGVVSAANYFPQECAEIYTAFRNGGLEAAKECHKTVQALSKATGARGSVAGVKCTMNLLGYAGGKPRRPIQPMSAQMEAEFAQALKEAGKLES